MNGNRGHVVIVGGGVVGAACAYFLRRAGWTVTVLDKGEFGGGCSHGNCGLVSPSHALPLTEPGAVRKTLRALLTPNAPFAIKPKLDPRLWLWLLKFAGRCRTGPMLQAARARLALLQSSMSLYEQLFESEPFDCEWEKRGSLFVFRTPKEMHKYAETDRLLREELDVAATRYDGDEVAGFEPALKPPLAGGWHYAVDGHLRPDRLMASWQRVLEGHGVTIREFCEVTRFDRAGGRARAVETDRGPIAADVFVLAAGALTPLFRRQLGCRIPIQPGKGYSITMPRPSRCPALPLLFQEHKVAVTPMQSGYRLGSTMELGGYDATLNRRRLDLLTEAARLYLHEPACEPLEEEWFGWRPMTYDDKPIIDASPAMDNVFVAAGHGMLGVSMAPGTGRLIAELLSGEPPHVDPRPFAIGRF